MFDIIHDRVQLLTGLSDFLSQKGSLKKHVSLSFFRIPGSFDGCISREGAI